MLVPEKLDHPSCTAESTSTPGAATSGFIRREIVVGPTEENGAWTLAGGLPLVSTAATVMARAELPGEETDPAPASL